MPKPKDQFSEKLTQALKQELKIEAARREAAAKALGNLPVPIGSDLYMLNDSIPLTLEMLFRSSPERSGLMDQLDDESLPEFNELITPKNVYKYTKNPNKKPKDPGML